MIRVRLIENYGVVLNGDDSGRDEIMAILNSGPKHIDELYSGGWSNITYFDVEQRRLDIAAESLDISIPLMHEHDLPICRVWQMGSRARLQLMVGDWDDAAADAERLLEFPIAPLARTWPSLIRAVVEMRKARHGECHSSTMPGRWRADSESRSGCCRSPRRSSNCPGSQADPTTASPSAAHLLEPTDPSSGWNGRAANWRSGCDGWATACDAIGVAEPYRLLLDGKHACGGRRLPRPLDAV